MCEANAQGSMGDYFRKGEVWCFNIKVTLDDLQVGCYAAEELICFAVCDVAKAENLPNLSRRKKLLELFIV